MKVVQFQLVNCETRTLNKKYHSERLSLSQSMLFFNMCWYRKITDLKLDNNWTTLPCFYCNKEIIDAIIRLRAEREIKNDRLRAQFPTSSTQNVPPTLYVCLLFSDVAISLSACSIVLLMARVIVGAVTFLVNCIWAPQQSG